MSDLLDLKMISKYLRREYPLLLLDGVTAISPRQMCNAYKNLTYNEWFFPVHFPEQPIMPGTLQLEAFSQAVALPLLIENEPHSKSGAPILLAGIDKVRYYRSVFPGDKFEIQVNIERVAMGVATASAAGFVNNDIASECKITYKLL